MSQWTRMSSRDEQEKAIGILERWIRKAGLRITGGTTIGKSPQTVILDLKYQDNAIYIDRDGVVRVYGTEIDLDDEQSFLDAIQNKEDRDGSQQD